MESSKSIGPPSDSNQNYQNTGVSPKKKQSVAQKIKATLLGRNKKTKGKNRTNQLGTDQLKNVETPDKKPIDNQIQPLNQEKVQPLARWKAATDKINKLTKGLNEGEGKILDPTYWQEKLIDDHPYGRDLQMQMEDWKADTSNNKNFEDWRTAKGLSSSSTKKVKYCDENERKAFEIGFSDGRLTKGGDPYSTKQENAAFSGPGSAIFVMSPGGKLYAGSHKIGQFHHSSFLSGGPVKSAGEIKTDEHGNITKITSKSGHYKPSKEDLLKAVSAFKNEGVNVDNIEVVLVGMDYEASYLSAESFLDSQGSILPDSINGLKLEKDDSGNLVRINQKYSEGKKNEAIESMKAIKGLNNDNLADVDFAMSLETGDKIFFNADGYIEDQSIPTQWEGGELKLDEDGNLKEIIFNKINGEAKDEERMVKVLDFLEAMEVNLTNVKLVRPNQTTHPDATTFLSEEKAKKAMEYFGF